MTYSHVPEHESTRLHATAQGERVLEQYTLGLASVQFIQHNGGIVFRIDADDGPYDNVLFVEDEIRLIDWTPVSLAHHCYELGVTLHHIFYQEPVMRHALLEGYAEVRALPENYIPILEAMIVYAALDNLAWNSTITTQLDAPLFRRNVVQFVDEFCSSLVADRPFLLTPHH